MRKIILLLISCLCLLSFTSCSKADVLNTYNIILQSAGSRVLSKDADLQGSRCFGRDKLNGTYTADFTDFSDKEILFGGTFLKRSGGSQIRIKCTLNVKNGDAKLLLKSGVNHGQVLIDTANQICDKTVTLPAGSNYVVFYGDNFTGDIQIEIL